MARLRFAKTAATFAADQITPIDQLIVAMAKRGWSLTISRESALQVPAVLRGRNLICAIATLPLVQYGPNRAPVRNALLDQIDPQIPNVVTMAQTVEDLLFDGIGYWRVMARGSDNFPVSAQHVDVNRVHMNPPPGAQSLNLLPSGADPSAAVWIDTAVVDGRDIIRFDSPNPPLLVAARRAIGRAVLLEQAAERYAESPEGLGYFSPTEGADPADDDDIKAMLADWNQARREGAVGYVPFALKYNVIENMSPADLQLAVLQARAALDLANAIGLDPEDLGVSTTSRTYQNATDRRQDHINNTLAPYMRAIADRLSMLDVTRRGYTVRFDLRDFLKADPVTRATVATAYSALGAVTVDEIREDDGRPILTAVQKAEIDANQAPAPAAPAPAPAMDPAAMDPMAMDQMAMAASSLTRSAAFAHQGGITFEAPAPFTVDQLRWTITGLVVPFGQVAKALGQRWRFAPDSLKYADISRVKLLVDHNSSQSVGKAIRTWQAPEGQWAMFLVARGPAGDSALALAADGTRDGLSIGVDFEPEGFMPDPQDPGVNLVIRAAWRETSLVAIPAFDDSRVTSVAASATPEVRFSPMPCQSCGQVHAAGTPCTQVAPAVIPTQVAPAVVSPATGPPAALAPVQFTADQLTALGQAIAAATAANEGPAIVNPRRTAALTVTRPELPYRMDQRGNFSRAEHDFSSDVFAAFKGDGQARERAERFIGEFFATTGATFATATTDVATLNPTRQRPDMYVDNLAFLYPIWNAIDSGSIEDATPFTLPQFATASGLVAAHTQGTEPTIGAFTTTSQTITPAPVSGKVEINREVIDQGGNPQVSGLIWREIERAYYEALEAKAVVLLNAVAATNDTTITTAAADAALEGEITAALAVLAYIRGGNRFRDFFIQVDLFKKLIAAKDTTGRKLFPVLNPVNATGTVDGYFGDVAIGSLRGRPAWALAASGIVAANSYLFDREDVHGWASAPRKLEFDYQVKSVFMGVWGYAATAVTRASSVRRFIYDPI